MQLLEPEVASNKRADKLKLKLQRRISNCFENVRSLSRGCFSAPTPCDEAKSVGSALEWPPQSGLFESVVADQDSWY